MESAGELCVKVISIQVMFKSTEMTETNYSKSDNCKDSLGEALRYLNIQRLVREVGDNKRRRKNSL